MQLTIDFEPQAIKQPPLIQPKYKINCLYYYITDPEQKPFRLNKVTGFIFQFDGGHWCTDNVFKDFMKEFK